MCQISVVSTVFNGEQFVNQAFDSILSQVCNDYEWIIVDDGSEDSTVASIKNKIDSDSRVKLFAPGRMGRARALNYAIEKSKGLYIANHDFDDISYPQRLSIQAKKLNDNPNIGLVGGYHIAVDKNRNEKYLRKQPLKHDEITRAMAKYIPLAHTIAMFRKSVWDEVNGYPIADNAIDMRMWLKVAKTDWKLSNVPSVLGEHFVYSNSYWHKNFNYSYRQIDLARLQARIVHDLNLPKWMYIYPLSRLLYIVTPKKVKKHVRRLFGTLKEKDL